MNVHNEIAAVVESEPVMLGGNWRDDNHVVLGLGLTWIERRLAGGEGEAERDVYDCARAAMLADAQRGDAPMAAIDRIGLLCGLSPFAEDVLLAAVAPAIDGRFAARYAALIGSPRPTAATPHVLARLLFGEDRLPPPAIDTLAGDAPLRRFALIEHAPDEAGRVAIAAPIAAAARVRDLLCGLDRMPDGLGLEARIPLPERLAASAAALAAEGDEAVRLHLVGPPRSGRRAFAVALLDELGLGAIVVETGAIEPAVLMREALLGGCGLILVGAAARAPHLGGPESTLADAPTPLIVIDESLSRVDLPVMRLPELKPAERRQCWPAEDVDEGDALAEQFALAPHEIAAIARRPAAVRWSAAREQGARDLAGLATRVVPERGWDDMVLPPLLRAELAVLSAQISARATVHGRWGYDRLLGRASGVTALFAGPSGVGKTMAAEALASELGLDLFTVDLARIASKYIGETEKNLAQLFDAAQAGGCVLFFDEADALFGKRSEVKDSHDRYANAEIAYLLQRMERFAGLAILATNLKSHLDAAFLRRIRMVVDFPMPDHATRCVLWRRSFPNAAPIEDIDWTGLARHELSPGNIVTVAANAAFRAAREGTPIGMRQIEAALAAEYRKLDRDPAGLAP